MNTDLFGQEIANKPTQLTMSGRKKRDDTPKGYARRPGTGPVGETCKTCIHAICSEGNRKNYYKCAVIEFRWTRGPGTDIRLKSPACEMWEAKNVSNDQKKLLKMAQRDAGLDDTEYRDAIAMATQLDGCRSSTDPRLSDEHFDRLMKYFEALFWNRPDALHHQSKVFRAKGYWVAKNQKGNTSRDRHVAESMTDAITALESRMAELGCNDRYCAAIRRRAVTQIAYKAALERTIKAKERSLQAANCPF